MNNLVFWRLLKAKWSTLQSQAAETSVNSDLLKENILIQVEEAKEIRKNYYRNDDFLHIEIEDE